MPKLLGQKEYKTLLVEKVSLQRENEALKQSVVTLKQNFSKEKAQWHDSARVTFKEAADKIIAKHQAELKALKTHNEATLQNAKKSVLRARQDARNARERAKRLQRNITTLEQELILLGDDSKR